MSDELLKIVLQKVESMEHKITSAKSLNGGFDKLAGDVEHIKAAQSEVLDAVRGVNKPFMNLIRDCLVELRNLSQSLEFVTPM